MNLRLSAFAVSLIVTMLVCAGSSESARAVPEARTVLALYDGRKEQYGVRFTRLHRLAEMPLNYLGLNLVFHDVSTGLPDLQAMPALRGVITWFDGPVFDEPITYLDWANDAVDSGLRYVVLGEVGAESTRAGRQVPLRALNRFLNKIGTEASGAYVELTFDRQVASADRTMVGFETDLSGPLPSYSRMAAVGDATSFLRLSEPSGRASDVVVIGRRGGIVAGGFTHTRFDDNSNGKWHIDPFRFFALAFDTGSLPKPDPAVFMGRRGFYSHIDGDGWNNPTRVERWRRTNDLSSRVILEEILKRFSDLPVTVAPIAAELDPDWVGTPEAIELAREMFRLPNVAGGTHTFSHPFDWGVFAPGRATSADGVTSTVPEENFLKRALDWLSAGRYSRLAIAGTMAGKAEGTTEETSPFAMPRAYPLQPFNLSLEIGGSAAAIESATNGLANVEIIQWSGNTQPFPEAIARSRSARLRNINGGDTRFDPRFPSYTNVAPIGVAVGDQRQIYTSASNENTYTYLWTREFDSYRNVRLTFENTWTPRRLKPINIYFHIYAGEREASLRALIDAFEYARTQEITPVHTVQYAAAADGFYSTVLDRIDDDAWRIERRDGLNTIRFDDAAGRTVDLGGSTGVLGFRRWDDALYVTLDASVEEPVLRVTTGADTAVNPGRIWLEQSRWLVRELAAGPDGVSFLASGFGEGGMVWRVPADGAHRIRVLDLRGEETLQDTANASGGLLVFVLPDAAGALRRVLIERLDG